MCGLGTQMPSSPLGVSPKAIGALAHISRGGARRSNARALDSASELGFGPVWVRGADWLRVGRGATPPILYTFFIFVCTVCGATTLSAVLTTGTIFLFFLTFFLLVFLFLLIFLFDILLICSFLLLVYSFPPPLLLELHLLPPGEGRAGQHWRFQCPFCVYPLDCLLSSSSVEINLR